MKVAVVGSRGLEIEDLGVFLPEYAKYRKNAPLKRNLQIIEYADIVLIFWDGESRGSAFVIKECEKAGVKHLVFRI